MWFYDVTCDMSLHSVSDFLAMLQFSFTCVTTANDGDVNFPK